MTRGTSSHTPSLLGLLSLHVRQGHPDFLDLPWELPLSRWPQACGRMVEVQRGLSRHEVVFAAYGDTIYALKELPPGLAEREYNALRELEERRLPAVSAVGFARTFPAEGPGETSVVITRFLESSLPYRTLFMNEGLERYRERLLDAMSVLLVRLHLAGCYWGDCSLSNTLFRRDAGELQAYLVDAETAELHPSLSSGQRRQDLMIMEENVAGELGDLAALVTLPPTLHVYGTGASIIQRYERLWTEINRETLVGSGESYRIQERIRALNELGFSVGEFELQSLGKNGQLRLRTIVTDRDYHRHQLHTLTGLVAGDRQAALLLNEIKALQATLTGQLKRNVSLSEAASRWLDERYRPTIEKLRRALLGGGEWSDPRSAAPVAPAPVGPEAVERKEPVEVGLASAGADQPSELSEMYCQVLEHKWFLSEKAQRDVGLSHALAEYLRRFGVPSSRVVSDTPRRTPESAPDAPG